MKLDTIAVHAGDRKRLGDYVPVTTPVYGAASYTYDRIEDLERVFAGEVRGQGYLRYGNPTTEALEELLAALEGGNLALAAASGMSALHLAVQASLIDRKASIVSAKLLFGQTITMLNTVFEPAGVAVRYVDACDTAAMEAAIAEEKPSCVLVETVSNPLLEVPAIDRIAEASHRHGAYLIVDSTFTPPVMFRPLAHGADFVIHSTTKYLAGHGDVLGGALITRDEFAETLTMLSRSIGPTFGPFEAYLAMRGVKTLPLRFERQCDNARRVAEALFSHPRVTKVHFPGLPEHPDHGNAVRLFDEGLFGAMVSFEVRDAGRDEIFRFVDGLKLVVRSLSLGDVHSLMCYPAMSTHRAMAPKQRQRLGISDSLVRLSVGIEDAEDIIADLLQALDR